MKKKPVKPETRLVAIKNFGKCAREKMVKFARVVPLFPGVLRMELSKRTARVTAGGAMVRVIKYSRSTQR